MNKPVIVCVDDELAVLESLKIDLKRVLGDTCLIELATGGEEALELVTELQAGSYEIALVLADYIMPDIKGDALLREIHSRSPHTLSIMISGQADLEAVSNAIRGARLFRYIAKPWRTDDLQATVTEAVHSFLQSRKLAMQAVQLRQLYQQVQEFNVVLERQVEERTAQLKQLLEFEAMLKRITDRVRESLDERQILKTAVQELATELKLASCKVTLYDLKHRTAEVCYEYRRVEDEIIHTNTLDLDDFPDLYAQLLQGRSLHCSLIPFPSDSRQAFEYESTLLVCPMKDEQGVNGDIWLFKSRPHVFDELEIRTVERVADQCAIALRQSQLYQLSQAQVQELERLSQVKDDFFSSISHDLRSPMAAIHMAIQMLEVVLSSMTDVNVAASAADRYLKILKDECRRETALINDLLDMARLEAGAGPVDSTTLSLPLWLPMIVEPFIERALSQQQQLLLEVEEDIPDLMTDPSYLERSLCELLHNACKYTPIGSTIQVSAKMSGQQFHISVRNFGVEIPVTEYDRIFDKFYRIANGDLRQQGGTGLGLALVKKQIEQLQGTIVVTSEPTWTMFTIQIPNISHP